MFFLCFLVFYTPLPHELELDPTDATQTRTQRGTNPMQDRLCLPELELILNLLALPGLVSLEQGIRAQFKFQTLQVSVILYIYSRRERFVVLVVSGLVQRQFWWF